MALLRFGEHGDFRFQGVVDNWLRPESANTRLDASEMEVMETALPWVREWLDTKRAARERRVAQRVSREASGEG